MAERIHHSRPTLGVEENDALSRVVASHYLARGPECAAFEGELASAVHAPFTHATSSGTAALHLSLLALGASPGKQVLIPSLTCAAVMNAVKHAGAEPVFYDCGYEVPDPKTLAKLVDKTVVAVIVVAPPQGFSGLQGYEASADGFAAVGGVPVLLDRCQQLSVECYFENGSPPARIETFSFYATKCICTGTGGAMAVRTEQDAGRVIDLNTHDERKSYDKTRFNYQFDELRAAVGRKQLAKLDEFSQIRREHAAAYAEALGGTPPGGGMVFRYLHDAGSEDKADKLREALERVGIECKRPVFRPLHRYAGMADTAFPLACDAWGRHVSLPLYPSLRTEERERVIRVIANASK